jgi:HD superfamily phosphohydrolase
LEKCKRIKDPIYGYISIPVRYMDEIIDTSSFQRIRRIIQTSYSPLYPSAVHNRFVHSLGVYHLGEIAINRLKNEIKEMKIAYKGIDRACELFLLACLLHDVGHAPFSHTGEDLYLDSNSGYDSLHEKLIEAVGCESFTEDVPKEKSKVAKPHEIMSVLVALKEYETFFSNSNEKEFFARCITGYKYSENTIENSISNCLISLLNSKVIDVDRLDYLIRDAFITGFDTISLDYNRLLNAITIIKDNDKYELGYYKSAISIIENVVYAHDAERKWIQSHPVSLYEIYILQHVFKDIDSKLSAEDNGKLFSIESLSKEGQALSDDINIRLMCDDDLIYFMKNVYKTNLSEEYFERKKRRHPIWKSEAEYKALFSHVYGQGSLLDNFEHAMTITAKYLTVNSDSWVIDDNLILKIEEELKSLNAKILDRKTIEVQKKDKKEMLKILKCLQKYSKEIDVECNYIILANSQFNSGFNKPDFSEIKIVFPAKNNRKVVKFCDVASSFDKKESAKNKEYFYLFYKRRNVGKDIDKNKLCAKLTSKFNI